MSGKARTAQHDLRFIEMNTLLSHGEPTPGGLKRMKELYHTISARHLSPPNVEKFMQVSDYLKRRENGMDHTRAYTTSILRKKEEEMKLHQGTKASKRATITRLKDKALVSQMEAQLQRDLAIAESMGMPKELFQSIMNDTLKGMGFRHEFNKSLMKAGFITELPSSSRSGGSGGSHLDKAQGEILVDTPEFNKLIEESVTKSLMKLPSK